MANREKDETIILRVPGWLKKALKDEAGIQSLSDYIRSILKQYLLSKNKESK